MICPIIFTKCLKEINICQYCLKISSLNKKYETKIYSNQNILFFVKNTKNVFLRGILCISLSNPRAGLIPDYLFSWARFWCTRGYEIPHMADYLLIKVVSVMIVCCFVSKLQRLLSNTKTFCFIKIVQFIPIIGIKR